MLDLQFKYNPWISLKILHQYFQDQIARNFSLVASNDTLSLAQKTGILVRNTPEGIILLYDTLRAEALRDYLMNHQSVSLSFYLYFSDPYFYTYTNTPLYINTGKHILYLDNQNTSKDKRLHKESFVSEEEFYQIQAPNWELKCEKAPQNLHLYDGQNQEIFQTTFEHEKKYSIDLSSLTEGKYLYHTNKEPKNEFILLKIDQLKKPLGLFNFTINNKLREEAIKHIEEMEQIPALNYEVCFDTRYTFWNYYIVPKYEEGLESLKIDTGDKKITFSGPTKAELPNGAQAYLFQSDMPLSLREISPYRFQLIKTKDAKGKNVKRILRRLPCPSLGPVKPESRDNNAKIYSEIIVYI